MTEERVRFKYNVASVPLIAATLLVLGLSYATLVRGELFRFWVHDGLAVAAAFMLFYVAHADPPPEMWRRRLIVLGGVVFLATTISG